MNHQGHGAELVYLFGRHPKNKAHDPDLAVGTFTESEGVIMTDPKMVALTKAGARFTSGFIGPFRVLYLGASGSYPAITESARDHDEAIKDAEHIAESAPNNSPEDFEQRLKDLRMRNYCRALDIDYDEQQERLREQREQAINEAEKEQKLSPFMRECLKQVDCLNVSPLWFYSPKRIAK